MVILGRLDCIRIKERSMFCRFGLGYLRINLLGNNRYCLSLGIRDNNPNCSKQYIFAGNFEIGDIEN